MRDPTYGLKGGVGKRGHREDPHEDRRRREARAHCWLQPECGRCPGTGRDAEKRERVRLERGPLRAGEAGSL